jgi:hypothetical protein
MLCLQQTGEIDNLTVQPENGLEIEPYLNQTRTAISDSPTATQTI